jgi:general L-amino acid transport system permease protein
MPSALSAVRVASVVFIEFVRGVPFIAILFMANNLLPSFARNMDARSLAACVGRNHQIVNRLHGGRVRGGFQSLRGQSEAGVALGLNYAHLTALVILPQALAFVIPGIVNNFIDLFMNKRSFQSLARPISSGQ